MTHPPAMSEIDRGITLIGGGRMGSALLGGWLKQGFRADLVTVVDPMPSDALKALREHYDLRILAEAPDLDGEVVVLAVKPQSIAGVSAGLRPRMRSRCLVLSIMAGVTIDGLRELFPAAEAILRAMPNLPASIGRGATVLVAEAAASRDDKTLVDVLLSTSGIVEWLDDEALLDAATALSGSGPGYTFYIVECLAEAGRRAGLPQATAMRLARATIEGSGALLSHSEASAATLRQDVTSPGGTTQAGLEVLSRDQRLLELISDAVRAAARRATELAAPRS